MRQILWEVNLYYNVVFEKVMAKLLTFKELETLVSETGCYSNSRPLTFLDEDLSYNILTPNHLIYGCNINQKCFDVNVIWMNTINESIYKKDKISLKTFQNMKLILENCFPWFKHKYGEYGGPLVSIEITTVNSNRSLKFNLKLDLTLNLKLNLILKLNSNLIWLLIWI